MTMTNAGATQFVKSWSTSVPVENSKKELESLLRRYGAHGFTVSNNYADRNVVVAFSIPRKLSAPSDVVEIRIPVDYREVKKRLMQITTFQRKPDHYQDAQAERVAWRHLVLLCEAALMAAWLGVQTLEEAFFAHQMLDLPNGGTLRAIDATQTAMRQLKARNE